MGEISVSEKFGMAANEEEINCGMLVMVIGHLKRKGE